MNKSAGLVDQFLSRIGSASGKKAWKIINYFKKVNEKVNDQKLAGYIDEEEQKLIKNDVEKTDELDKPPKPPAQNQKTMNVSVEDHKQEISPQQVREHIYDIIWEYCATKNYPINSEMVEKISVEIYTEQKIVHLEKFLCLLFSETEFFKKIPPYLKVPLNNFQIIVGVFVKYYIKNHKDLVADTKDLDIFYNCATNVINRKQEEANHG